MSPLLMIGALALAQTGQSQTGYMDADAVLAKIAVAPTNSALATPSYTFVRDVGRFGRRTFKSPDDQARAWVELVHRGLALSSDPFGMDFMHRGDFLKALPEPSALPIAESLLEHDPLLRPRSAMLLKLLLLVLQGKNRDAWTQITRLKHANLATDDTNLLADVELPLAIHMRDLDLIETSLDDESTGPGGWAGPSFWIPDLEPLMGPDRSYKLIVKLLATKKGEFVIGDGSPCQTTELAVRAACDHVDRLAYPQWTLAASPLAGDAFLRMVSRFPAVTMGIAEDNPPSWSTYEGAAIACLVNLWAAGKAEEAKLFAEKYAGVLTYGWFRKPPPPSLLRHLWEQNKLESFARFLGDLAPTHPKSGLPDLFLSFAEGNLAPAEIEVVARKCAPADGESGYGRMSSALLTALLQQGKLAEAAQELVQHPDAGSFPLAGPSDTTLLHRLGQLLHRPDLIAVSERRKKEVSTALIGRIGSGLPAGADNPSMERYLIKNLREGVANPWGGSPPADQMAVLNLVAFYTRLGRGADVVTLLDRFAHWEAPDLRLVPFGSEIDHLLIAKTLAAHGRGPEARRLLEFALERYPGYDDAYALLLSLCPNDADRSLDALARDYPLENRPLIWRAEWLRRKRRLAEAKALCERAIAMEPSDVGSGNRPPTFPAQAILAAIDRDLGDTASAAPMESYKQVATTMAEASDLDRSGLATLAVAGYRKALAAMPHFFPARYALARVEMRMGDPMKATEDLQAALLDLPLRLGANTSFASDLVMGSPREQSVLNLTLHTLIDKGSKNAVVYVCAGMVDRGRGDFRGALQEFARAVELDPDCLTAWIELAKSSEARLAGLQKKAVANCLRLGIANAQEIVALPVSDFGAVRREIAAMPRRLFGPMDPVYPLKASIEELRNHGSAQAAQQWLNGGATYQDPRPPLTWLADEPLISAIDRMLSRTG